MAKINNYCAGLIARRIAEKALEHEYAPLATTAEETARKIHDDFFENHISGRTTQRLLDHQVLCPSYCVEVCVADAGRWQLSSGDYQCKPFYTTQLELHIEEHIALFKQHVLPAIACRGKIDELAKTIQQQLVGKQTATVCKKWPEVAGFVSDAMGNSDTAEMTTPFSDLLKQFIALPAPTPANA